MAPVCTAQARVAGRRAAGRPSRASECGDLRRGAHHPLVQRQATGTDLLEGLTALWNLHSREGLQDDGQRTFCRFDLRWGAPSASTDIDYCLPHHAAGAPKLRRWLLAGEAQSLLTSLARAHLRLLERGGGQVANRILEVAAQAEGGAELERGLTRLTGGCVGTPDAR